MHPLFMHLYTVMTLAVALLSNADHRGYGCDSGETCLICGALHFHASNDFFDAALPPTRTIRF